MEFKQLLEKFGIAVEEPDSERHIGPCTKPKCKCIEIAEQKKCGPVKSFPCLAQDINDDHKKRKDLKQVPS